MAPSRRRLPTAPVMRWIRLPGLPSTSRIRTVRWSMRRAVPARWSQTRHWHSRCCWVADPLPILRVAARPPCSRRETEICSASRTPVRRSEHPDRQIPCYAIGGSNNFALAGNASAIVLDGGANSVIAAGGNTIAVLSGTQDIVQTDGGLVQLPGGNNSIWVQSGAITDTVFAGAGSNTIYTDQRGLLAVN